MKYLVINADDFGFSEGVNSGIVEAWAAGMITSTSVMPTAPAFADAVERAKERANLPIGVHFSVSSGMCCTQPDAIGTIADSSGAFLSRENTSFQQQMAIAARVSPAELELELRAQFDRVVSVGIRPQHVDCHHAHLYAVPALFAVVLKLASEWKVAARFPFGDNVESSCADMARMYSVNSDTILALAKSARAAKAAYLTITTDRYFQIQSFWDKATKRAYLLKLLETLPDGVSELCFHPGRGNADRENDLELIVSPEISERIENSGIVIHNPLVGW